MQQRYPVTCGICELEFPTIEELDFHRWQAHYAEMLRSLAQSNVRELAARVKLMAEERELKSRVSALLADPTLSTWGAKYLRSYLPSSVVQPSEDQQERMSEAEAALGRWQKILDDLEAQT